MGTLHSKISTHSKAKIPTTWSFAVEMHKLKLIS